MKKTHVSITVLGGLLSFGFLDSLLAVPSDRDTISDSKHTDTAIGMTWNRTETDLEVTRRLRRSLLDRDDLSTSSKNVQIDPTHGVVTMKGAVPSMAERDTILNQAEFTVGKGNVRNEMVVLAR